ncbi:MAG: acetylxylan esterase [Planctomycetales bacterium]|nr:acetylxylan esterase [Planctomycetales bacterium]
MSPPLPTLLRPLLCVVCALVSISGLSPLAHAQAPRVSAEGALPADQRLEPLKDLDGYFPFVVPDSLPAWEERRAEVRRRVLVANGLWPMPSLGPVQAEIHGRVERDGYTVDRVYFESLPGFYVTGSLYRPVGKTGPFPAVLCPHGHWANGRFYDAGDAEAARQIAAGAEQFDENAHSPLQSRCAHLARMGCIVFHYDMIGYADSQQISFDLAHRFATQRPELNGADAWGLFSPRAESLLQSVMGLQTLNSIRALDFLESLPDVDRERLAVTGASGGGTQTFMLAAIDDRLATAFPAVMVSTAMQGGCTCENCSLLRVGTGNVEFAALFAPKPQGMTAADDWTKEMETKGFPELQKLYGMYGASDRVHLLSRTEFGHNYNAVGREAMYGVFADTLGLELAPEGEIKRLTVEEMTVWDDNHPRPPGGTEFETSLMSSWDAEFRGRLEACLPTSSDTAEFRRVVGAGVQTVIGRAAPSKDEVTWEATFKEDRGGWLEIAGWLRNAPRNETLPAVFLHPRNWNGKVVLWFGDAGKDSLYGENGRPLQAVVDLVNRGVAVGAVDLFGQGEFVSPENDFTRGRRVANPRESAGYTFGYNSSLFAQRVHDVMSTLAYVAHDDDHEFVDKHIMVVGSGAMGPVVAAALSQTSAWVDDAWVETNGFRFADVPDLQDPAFLPGGARYHDLPGLIALAAPVRLTVIGESTELPAWVSDAFAAEHGRLELRRTEGGLTPNELLPTIE